MAENRMDFSEFRSDTFTVPDEGMRRAIYQAEVGNSGFGEDPSVNALEETMADFFGRDAAVFLPSATMAGQIAIRVWTRPGDVVVIEKYGHNYYFETGAMSAIAGVQASPLPANHGILDPAAIAAAIRHPENNYARTSLVILENTPNFGGGTVYRRPVLDAIFAIAAEHTLPVHIDGARIWNALVASGDEPAGVIQPGGSMSVCFSKGLGAPMGAVLVGDAEFIREARRIQKILGGAMRQIGFMAAAALYGFRHNYRRLAEDHENASILADSIREIDGIHVDMEGVQTNMIYVDVAAGSEAASAIVNAMCARGVRVLNVGSRIRFVTSMLVDRQDCEHAAKTLEEVMQDKNLSGERLP